jgi:aminopeptidase N
MRFFNLIGIVFFLLIVNNFCAVAQFTHADTLRGTNGEDRKWWNVTKYDIVVEPNIDLRTITANVQITFDIVDKIYNGQNMQIDLQQPLQIDSIAINNQIITSYLHQKNVCIISNFKNLNTVNNKLTVWYHGQPVIARFPPWDGGLIWKTDKKNNPFISVACQQKGASVWYPCKDIQSDEPDSSSTITIITPDTLQGIGNGRLIKSENKNRKLYNTWQVKNPINNYNLVFYIGKYTAIKKQYDGLNGKLDCTFWALAYNQTVANSSMEDVFKMMASFEKWFGAYPWYNDGYQLVEAPHLGMEHQSAIAYGNAYKKGYMGKDLSKSGWGKSWDYIIVHESGHEWWGNHVSTKDIADMWIHEGFTTYSEALFVEEQFGKNAADEYIIGLRKNIENKEPMIGDYGVNKEPTGDIYYKGASVLHMIRTIVNDDEKFRKMLHEMQKKFGKKTCNSVDVELFISQYLGINLEPFFRQYLYTNQIPKLKFEFVKKGEVKITVTECNDSFRIPFDVPISKTEYKRIDLIANKSETVYTNLSKSNFMDLIKKGYYFFE